MRGTLVKRAAIGDGDGIIPAHAGNTLRPSHASSMHGDHPRACGEHPDHDRRPRKT